jgi:hypothetical protein
VPVNPGLADPKMEPHWSLAPPIRGLRDTRSTIRSPNIRLRIRRSSIRRFPMNIFLSLPPIIRFCAAGLIVSEKWANSQAYELKRERVIGI